jgi:fucose permease
MMRDNKNIWISYLSYIALGTFDGLIGVVWPAMSQRFGVPLEALGLLLLVALAGFVMVSFTSGLLIRALTFPRFLLTGLLLRTVGFIGLAIAPSWPLLLAVVFFSAIGAGAIDTGLNLFVSRHGNARQINWLHACFGVGATVGPFLAAGVLAAGGDWTWNFAAVAAFMALISLLVWTTSSSWQMDTPEKSESAGQATHARFVDSLRLPVIWISTVLFFLYVGTELTAGQWSFSLFTLGRGLPDLDAKFWVGTYWGIFTIGRILFGLIAHRVRIDTFLRVALAAMVGSAILLWWNPLPWVGFAGLVAMGLAEAPIYPSLIAATAARVGKQHVPNAIGFQTAAGGVGGTALTGLVGLLATSVDLEMIAVSIVTLAVFTLLAHEVLLIMSRARAANNQLAGKSSQA